MLVSVSETSTVCRSIRMTVAGSGARSARPGGPVGSWPGFALLALSPRGVGRAKPSRRREAWRGQREACPLRRLRPPAVHPAFFASVPTLPRLLETADAAGQKEQAKTDDPGPGSDGRVNPDEAEMRDQGYTVEDERDDPDHHCGGFAGVAHDAAQSRHREQAGLSGRTHTWVHFRA